ncbi:C2 domain [Dillenia turbinata]|uniref:C2 domain n=1 Tax=Dillenia turbinata TaxID=194707 RepID=A0AAN8ZDH3_9MAGN
MVITEMSILHHVGIALVLLWLLSSLSCCHPIAYFICLIYLYQVHETYVLRLRRKLQFEERKQAHQKRVLSDSESVRWLNHAVEKIWPVCMEDIASKKILLPIIPWFLDKYKPWTAKKAVVQHLYLGRSPPLFTEMRVLRHSSDDDHLVLQLGMNFLTADDMSAILAVKLRKRLGFGMWAKLHITGMHVEGKVLIGVRFIRKWPFLGRLRVCFAEPPYFQMTVKPIFTHGLDVTELPGIAGWLDKLLATAFEQTLVEVYFLEPDATIHIIRLTFFLYLFYLEVLKEFLSWLLQPNMLVVDVEKLASPTPENWFSVDEKEPVAYVKVEVVEASDMKPSDLNGLADPYVKGQLGPYRFRTQTQKRTLAPKWQEEFRIPICTWESPNVLAIEVCDKDHFVDDNLGVCSINVGDLRDGHRHDMWLPLQNIKVGRLHLAITVLETDGKGSSNLFDEETMKREEDEAKSLEGETAEVNSFSSTSKEKSAKLADKFEPINVEGLTETGIWVHQPGSDVPQSWEPRKGKNRILDTQIQREVDNSAGNSSKLATSGSSNNDSSSTDENTAENKRNPIKRGLRKIGSVFHRSPRKEDNPSTPSGVLPLPHVNLRAVNVKNGGVKFVIEDVKVPKADEKPANPEECSADSSKNVKGMAKSFLKHAGNSARGIKHALSRKGSRKSVESGSPASAEIPAVYDSSDDESSSATQNVVTEGIQIASGPITSLDNNSCNSKERNILTGPCDLFSTFPDLESKHLNGEVVENNGKDLLSRSESHGNGSV